MALSPFCDHVDIWRTVYLHRLDNPEAIVKWVEGAGLRPFLAPLSSDERQQFLARYREAIEAAYPRRTWGGVLLPFPRLFVVVRRAAEADSQWLTNRQSYSPIVPELAGGRHANETSGHCSLRERGRNARDLSPMRRTREPSTPSRCPRWPIQPTPKLAAKQVFGRAMTPTEARTRSIGFYSHGCLAGAKALPVDGETWSVMRLSRNRNLG